MTLFASLGVGLTAGLATVAEGVGLGTAGAIGAGAGAAGAAAGTGIAGTLAGTAGAIAGSGLAPIASALGAGAAAAAPAVAGGVAFPASSAGASTAGSLAADAGLTAGGSSAAGTGAAAAGPITGSSMADSALVQAGMGGLQQGIGALQANSQQKAQNKAYQDVGNQIQQGTDAAQGMADSLYNTGMGGGKIMGAAGGGKVSLESGQFIIPADVVADIGNGSTEAGTKFLNEYFGAG